MKKYLSFFIAAVTLLCCLTGCFGGTKTYSCQGLSMTVPSEMDDVSSQKDFSAFTFTLDSDDMAVFGLKESFDELGTTELTLQDYAKLVMDANNLDGFATERSNYPYYYFRYTKDTDEGIYRYLGAVYQAKDGFWMIQIAAPMVEYDETAFFEYLDTVTVS